MSKVIEKMDSVLIFCIAIGVGMDCFVISLTTGLTTNQLKLTYPLKIAFFFGIFQSVMLFLGWSVGSWAENLVLHFDHWIGFGILFFIGFKMVYESLRTKTHNIEINPLNIRTLLWLSLATSIDAFAVGTSFAFLKIYILTPVIIVGCITFLMSFSGVYIGKRLGYFLGEKAKILGGVILILMGIKILYEHL